MLEYTMNVLVKTRAYGLAKVRGIWNELIFFDARIDGDLTTLVLAGNTGIVVNVNDTVKPSYRLETGEVKQTDDFVWLYNNHYASVATPNECKFAAMLVQDELGGSEMTKSLRMIGVQVKAIHNYMGGYVFKDKLNNDLSFDQVRQLVAGTQQHR